MKKSYPYLNDSDFLYLIDTQHLQNQFVKLTLLDWAENPLQEIQGVATSGSVSINGNSSVRRTMNLNMAVKSISDGKITDAKNLISINKKVFVEVGIENKTNKWKEEYPIIWFPQGVMVIKSCSVTSSLSEGTTLSAQFSDKMCLLNGECGGTLTSSTQFDKYDTIDENGNWITLKPTISQIIREAVNHFGGEQLGKILISDIDERVKLVQRWTGNVPIYLINKDGSYILTTDKSKAGSGGYVTYNYGDDIGFIYTDFTYPTELIGNIGDTITTILDKIKNTLGNYEYYYDVFGNFIFQEIKNYLNTTHATTEIKKLSNSDYIVDMTKGKTVYSFNDSKLVTSYSNNPQYNKIKNDYVVWGIRENAEGIKMPIRYHLAIDNKPEIGNIYEVFFYTDPDDGLVKAKCPVKFINKSHFPKQGAAGVFYMDMTSKIIYKWDGNTKEYVDIQLKTIAEYPTRADFPTLGDKQTLYIDLSTGIAWEWVLVPGSPHWQAIMMQIRAKQAEFEAGYQALQNQIDNIITNNIEPLQNEIDALKLAMQDDEEELYQAEQKLAAIEKSITDNEATEAQISAEIAILDESIQELNNKMIETQRKIDKEKNPEEKAFLQAQYDLYEYTRDREVIERNTRQLALDKTAEVIEDLQEARLVYLGIIARCNENLAPLRAQMAVYEEEMANYESQIETLQNEQYELNMEYERVIGDLREQQYEYVESSATSSLVKVQATDWRSELYLSGAAAEPLGLESNYYYPELEAEWPKIYDLRKSYYLNENNEVVYTGDFYDEVLNNPWDIDYFLDFIDTDNQLMELSVNNIGRRSITESKDDYNCVFEPEIPDFVLIEAGQPDTDQKREECESRNQAFIQVDISIFELLASGGMNNACFTRIKDMLWDNTSYNNAINLSIVPIYHLEPNTRIGVTSVENDISGDFMINSLSIPLNISGTMSISATKCSVKL